MPLFGNQQQNQGTAVWEPQAADGRLAQTAGANPAGVFTSDLSVSEYVLLGEAGFEPLGFVVGSSIYHVGLQAGRWSQNQELQILTQAMYNAREVAMARMRAEADHLSPTRACSSHSARRARTRRCCSSPRVSTRRASSRWRGCRPKRRRPRRRASWG
jgi:hypothetical protein